MKKIIVAAMAALSLSCALFAAPKAAPAPVEPIKVALTAANMAENQATMQNQVFNVDGSVTYDAMMKYGGGAVTFFINGKAGVNLKDYKTIHVEFDYAQGASWKNPAKLPKFKIVTWGPGATFYQGAVDRCYFDADSAKGTMVYDLDIAAVSGKAVKIAIPLNAWQWDKEGGSEEDLVNMKIKSITLLP